MSYHDTVRPMRLSPKDAARNEVTAVLKSIFPSIKEEEETRLVEALETLIDTLIDDHTGRYYHNATNY